MKNLLQQKTFLYCLLLCLLFLGCYGGCGLDVAGEGSNFEFRARISSNETSKVAVTDEGPLQGTEVRFEKDSISGTQTISIDRETKPASLPSGYKSAGECVSFTTNGSSQFAKPVQVKLPYSDEDQDSLIDGSNVSESDVQVLYWNEEQDKWQEIEVLDIEAGNNRAIFETSHFSTYITAIQEQDQDTLDESQEGILPGESFVGEPVISENYNHESGEWETEMLDPGASHYMTVRRDEKDLLAVVGPFVTLDSSHPATIQTPDFASAIFNATKYYPKVARSGSTANWNWTCEFISEHTHLRDYETAEDNIREPGEDAIFCETEVVNDNLVRLVWSINAEQQISQGHMLAIEFMGTYSE
ncbi:MAG: hypothetical protein ACOCZ2_00905 [Thermodesulfobacteriota bacterium]